MNETKARIYWKLQFNNRMQTYLNEKSVQVSIFISKLLQFTAPTQNQMCSRPNKSPNEVECIEFCQHLCLWYIPIQMSCDALTVQHNANVNEALLNISMVNVKRHAKWNHAEYQSVGILDISDNRFFFHRHLII